MRWSATHRGLEHHPAPHPACLGQELRGEGLGQRDLAQQPDGQILDCDGGCTNESWLGDNYCDQAFNCSYFYEDYGDCP